MITVCRLVINLTVRYHWPLIKWSILEFGRVYNQKSCSNLNNTPTQRRARSLYSFAIQTKMSITQNLTISISSSSSSFLSPSNFNSRYQSFISDPTHYCFLTFFFKNSILFCLLFQMFIFFSSAGVRYHCLWRVSAFVNALLHPKKLRLVGNLSCNLIISVWLLWFMILLQIQQ